MSINSYHIFIFPFRWDNITSEDFNEDNYFSETSLSERIKIDFEFNKKITDCGWTYKPFNVDSDLTYNQYNYFYDFVKKSLYNTNKDFSEEQIIYSYEKESLANSKLKLNITDTIYNLDLEKVELKIFNTGIGLLCLNIANHNYNNFDDILKINDFGRRFYPQFVQDEGASNLDFSSKTKVAFLPKKISIETNESLIKVNEEFKLLKRDLKNPLKDTSYILQILNDSEKIFSFSLKKENSILIKPIIDDRMFVISYAEQDFSLKDLKKGTDIEDIWYKYLFIDGKGKTCQSDDMTKKLISEATYERWIKYNSLYGFTRYSFVTLTSKQTTDLFLNHIKGVYFNLVLSLLVQRASLLRFSEELSLISNLKEESDDQVRERFSSVYRNYLKFVNNLCFDEITPQEQGIELYDLGVKQLRLESQNLKLEKRIKDIHKFISMDMEINLFLSRYFD